MKIGRTGSILSLCGMLFFGLPVPVIGDPTNVYGYSVAVTPYDQKIALKEVLMSHYTPPPASRREPLDRIFFKARRIAYLKDRSGDEWQSPSVTQTRKAGDCEDKALWLYDQLKRQGYGDSLRLVIGKYRAADKKLHVWLMRGGEGRNVYILDPANQDKVWDLQTMRPGFYKPFFSFDGDHRYCHLGHEKTKAHVSAPTFPNRLLSILREMTARFL